ncbi:MAG TPA: carbamoyltransferase HypF [Negativicutes bacterium]|nr:carbamoyltransferase HypF [Negativicutes bacterium]
MLTIEYHIWGIVQGVGFRPFIARLARECGLKGQVYNVGGGVCITVTGRTAQLDCFESRITAEKPQPSEIVHQEKRILAEVGEYQDFAISESTEGENDMVFISPDLSICESCEKELEAPSDPRYEHPFISCMECGPRYSIIDRVPYDRDNTSMVDFEMCGFCTHQYKSSEERRYHAQTISCHQCGPQLEYAGRDGLDHSGEAALRKTIDVLNNGGIVGIKGIGGYHLACSALDETAARQLRMLKGREAKPFAVMFRDLAEIRSYCNVSEAENRLISGKEKPIVLLEQNSTGIPEEVNKGSRFMGCFLPYTPLQRLILKETPPLIMTSANISDSPIIKDDRDMLEMPGDGLTGVLYNKRDIRVGIDDSVTKVINGEAQFIRRSRGYAPLPVYINSSGERFSGDILATGGQTKNTFCLLTRGGRMPGSLAYISQHIGDLDDLSTYDNYLNNIEHMKGIFDIKPERICCDLHPGYASTDYAESTGLEVVKVQHHFAHIASVMAEKGIIDPVIGIAYDGTGYGTDGRIWGGEFLICSPSGFERAAQLSYVPMPGGDGSVREAWKSAAAYLYSAGLEEYISDPRWKLLKSAVEKGINTVESSSMGRLFDAVSSILDISHTAAYEGESAILLENKAAEYIKLEKKEKRATYGFDIEDSNGSYKINMKKCIRGIVEDKLSGESINEIAYRFHRTVSRLTVECARLLRVRYGINKAAISGGVFQNGLLFPMVLEELRQNGFEVYYNTKVPANDGGISLGQAFAGIYGEV